MRDGRDFIHHRRSVNANVAKATDGQTIRPRAYLRRSSFVFVALALAVTTFDQVTKVIVRRLLVEGSFWPPNSELIRFSHVENSGAAFGILQGAGEFLLVTTVVVVLAIIVYVILVPPQSMMYTVALGLILGGAIGNLIDRASRGTVTDFIDPTHYPAFNIADSAIVIGAVGLLYVTFRKQSSPTQPEPDGDFTNEHTEDRGSDR